MEPQCEQTLEQVRWPEGFHCTHCGAAEHGQFYVEDTRYWQCRRCRSQTSLHSGTILHGTNLALRTWFQAMFLISKSKMGTPTLELKRQFGVGYPTVWRVKQNSCS